MSGVLYNEDLEVPVSEYGFLTYSGAFASKRRSRVILLCMYRGCLFLSTVGRQVYCQRSKPS